ncbi:NAD(P)-dependent oxidoreductase [Sneathiella limimaris]|uniref:NAD(P)-dependent oxidoreductase n=1 Tax=Sneathiella limimaris TaxID=1964213 RepID=UPI001469A58D|nr:NAD(P)-dependent oxidoreductase [Sneathiella limimaris]
MTTQKRLGFIGLGVMGEPICRNILKAGLGSMQVLDLNKEPVQRLVADGASEGAGVRDLAATSDILFLSLPGGKEVEAILTGEDGILSSAQEGLIVVDLSTCPVGLTRDLHEAAKAKGVEFIDAPVARTRQAAIDGTLSIMVGATNDQFAVIKPFLEPAASEITHCGEIGTGQVMKVMNNMVLFQTVVALAEAMVTAEAAGVSKDLLLSTLSQGSADSFALRNHGMKAMVPGIFPLNAFATDYAIKDITYALELAADGGVETPSAELAKSMLERSSAAGYGAEYFPALIKVVEQSRLS